MFSFLNHSIGPTVPMQNQTNQLVMIYLHNCNIIFRDLKPNNCGYDMNGVFKLFDFGLATALPPGRNNYFDEYHLTGHTGSRRYMAPEVFQCAPYGKPADVFSFAILLWELLSLKTPFEAETMESHAKKVYGYRKLRPQIKLHWPKMLQQLICECWSADASNRPPFYHINLCLRHSQL